MASKAYIKLLDKAYMTVNTFAPNPFMEEWNGQFDHKPTVDGMAEFIAMRLARFNVKGYSTEYIKQLIIENECNRINGGCDMVKLNFELIEDYDSYQEYIDGDYKIVRYMWRTKGSTTYKEKNWRAYKRIDGLKGRPFGNNVDSTTSDPYYNTRKQAERVCQKDYDKS